MQIAQGQKQPKVLPNCDIYQLQQWPAMARYAKGAIEALILGSNQ